MLKQYRLYKIEIRVLDLYYYNFWTFQGELAKRQGAQESTALKIEVHQNRQMNLGQKNTLKFVIMS